METYNRICVKSARFKGGEHEASIERGKEYLTSAESKDGTVIVFTNYWIYGVPVELFAGEEQFTKPSKQEQK